MLPPLCLTTPNTVARPSPVPAPAALVVKNGSNRGGWTPPPLPPPVSETPSSAFGPGVPSDRLGALGLREPLLQPAALADVMGEHERGVVALERDPSGRDLDVDE